MNKSDLDKMIGVESENYLIGAYDQQSCAEQKLCKHDVISAYNKGASFASNLLLPEIEKLNAENQRFREALENIRDINISDQVKYMNQEMALYFAHSTAKQALSPQKKEGV